MQRLNFLVIGSGAREHAVCYKLKQSKYLKKLYLADANDGFRDLGINIEYKNLEHLAQQAKSIGVDIAFVGGEVLLAQGIVDIFKTAGIKIIGTDKYWTQLESSKLFGKKFMERHKIKTAKYKVIQHETDIDLSEFEPPFVIKADGLCAGKGVTIVDNKNDTINTIKEYLQGKFGEASKTVILEEFFYGEEISLISLWDGVNLKSFVPVRDFKRLSVEKYSPNTGGMGAFCPLNLTLIQENKLQDYLNQLEKALKQESADFCGFIYSGLIWSQDRNHNDFRVLEYNTRLGDPEAQALLTHLESDFGQILYQMTEKKLNETEFRWKNDYTAVLTIAAEGYPTKPQDNQPIDDLDKIEKDVQIFFAGVKKEKGKLFSKGGRVLSLCTTSKKPFDKLYKSAQIIKMPYKYFRDDLKKNEDPN